MIPKKVNAIKLDHLAEIRIKKEQIIVNSTRELLYLYCIIKQNFYNIDAGKLHTILTNKIEDLMLFLTENNFSSNEINIARYLLSAALDEVTFRYTESSQRYQSLTSQYYKGELGGIYFFTNLEELEKDIKENSALLTLGLMILYIGFKGQYAIENDGLLALEVIKNRLYFSLKRSAPKNLQQITISKEGDISKDLKQINKRLLPIMILILFIFYFISYQSLSNKVQDLRLIIKEIFEL